MSKWIRSLEHKVDIELLDEVDENMWEITEQYWICQLRSWGIRLLNIDIGGHGLVRGRRRKSEESKRRKIDKYSLDGKFVQSYNSITDAVKCCGLKSKSSITNLLIQGNGRQAGGFRWAYHGQSLMPYRRVKVTVAGRQYIYPDIMSAGKSHKFDRSKVRKLLEESGQPVRRERLGLLIEYDIV